MDTPTAPTTASAQVERSLDATSLDAFVREHHGRLVRLARLVCRDQAEAGDAVQSALEKAWRRRNDLRDPDALRSWLDRIVVREAIRVDRRRRSILGRFLGAPREIAVEPAHDYTSRMPAMLDLRTAFEALTSEQRAVLALHLHYGYSIAQTAAIVDAPIETVRSRLRVGRERLRTALGDPR